MVSGLLRWTVGWVRVEVEGGYPARLLNEITAADVAVWHIRCKEETTRFSCFAGDYRRLRPMARRACVRMRMRQKHGFPFWRYRYRHRKGLLVGAAIYAAILLLLAPRIWVVEVAGNHRTDTAAILRTVAEYGVSIGERTDRMAVKELQLHGPDQLSTVAFITVNPSGCVAQVEVTERDPTPEVLDFSVPSDLVALRDGLILRMKVRSGTSLVQVGEAVSEGTTLITGLVPSALGDKRYRAYGEVWAETRRRITVTVPLTYTRCVLDGAAVCRPTISFLCWEFPLYSDSALQGENLHIQRVHRLTVRERELPLGVINEYCFPLSVMTETRTAQEAEVLAYAQLAKKETGVFMEATEYERVETSGQIVGDNYILTAVYTCCENIAVEVPMEGFNADS